MYRKQVRRRRAVLVVLVVVCLALISTHFSEGSDGPLHSVQDGLASVLSPIEEGASRALKPGRDLVNWFEETFDARGENEELADEVAELRQQVVDLERAAAKNDELNAVEKLAADDELAGLEPVPATVIARSPSVWFGTLTIDKGRSAGVEVDDSVITGDGLVGRVSSVAGGSARVMLVSDPESQVTVRALPGGPPGLVGPEVGNPGVLRFEVIASDKEVKQGEKLVTAGFSGNLSSRFPAGIPVGEVTEVRETDPDLEQQYRVRPYTKLADLTTVSVLTGGPR